MQGKINKSQRSRNWSQAESLADTNVKGFRRPVPDLVDRTPRVVGRVQEGSSTDRGYRGRRFRSERSRPARSTACGRNSPTTRRTMPFDSFILIRPPVEKPPAERLNQPGATKGQGTVVQKPVTDSRSAQPDTKLSPMFIPPELPITRMR